MKKVLLGIIACVISLSATAQWKYRSETDKMTDKQSTFAISVSKNTFQLGFPYGGKQHGYLTVMNRPRDGLNILLEVARGQIICDDYDTPCAIPFRFDKDEMVWVLAGGPSDHSTELLFLYKIRGSNCDLTGNASCKTELANKIKSSKTILVQLPFFHNGHVNIEFMTDNLKFNIPSTD